MTDASAATSAGIEALIERLRREGVEEGAAEAARIVEAAERRARAVLDAAEAEAAALREAARAAAERFRRGGEEALRVAMRDAELEMKETLGRRFAEQVRGAVSGLMRDEEMLKRMILAVAARARTEADADAARALEAVLPRSVVGLDQLRRKPEEMREGSLTRFAAAEAARMLREGVTFARADDDAEGIRIVLKDEGVVIDLTDAAVADVILRHLQPRFRALLEGVVS